VIAREEWIQKEFVECLKEDVLKMSKERLLFIDNLRILLVVLVILFLVLISV